MSRVIMTIRIEDKLLKAFNEACAVRHTSTTRVVNSMLENVVSKFDGVPLPEAEGEGVKRVLEPITNPRKLAIRVDRALHERFSEIVKARAFHSGDSTHSESISSVVRAWMKSVCPNYEVEGVN